MLLPKLLEGYARTKMKEVSKARLCRDHPKNDVTIVWCLDPRGLGSPDGSDSALEAIIRQYEAPDLIQDVGGAYRLCFEGSNRKSLLSSIRKSIRLHQAHLSIKKLVLMLHADCGFLKDSDLKRRSSEDPAFPKEMFLLALNALSRNLAEKMPGLQVDVRCVYVDFDHTTEITI